MVPLYFISFYFVANLFHLTTSGDPRADEKTRAFPRVGAMRSSVVPTELLISVGYPELLHAAATATLLDLIAIRAAAR